MELDAPAAVQVRTDAVVSISVIEHNRKGAHIGLLQRTYHVPLATSSGFAVDPTGGVVTTGRVVDVDLDRANIYAANQIFHERYGDRAPLPADPYARTSIVDSDPSDPLNPRLQRCYQPNTTDTSGGCVVATTREVRVLPFVSDQTKYGNLSATVLYPTTGTSDVAVLRVGANSMPTVRLGSALSGAPYALLGFTTTPADAASERNVLGHFAAAGKPEIKRDETFAAQVKALRAGAQGGPVVGETGEVLGFFHVDGGPADSDSTITLVGADKVREALKAAAVTAHSGPTDTVYEAASHDYKNALYTAAVPNLTQTLKLYPGHALASEHLADARAKAGTDADKTGKDNPSAVTPTANDKGSGTSYLLPSVLGGLGLVILALVILLLRRRPRRSGKAPAAPPMAPYPPSTPLPGPAVPVDLPRPVVDPGEPTVARVPVPRQAQPHVGPGDDGSQHATQPPGAGGAQARAGSSASAQERWSKSREAASGIAPFSVVKADDGRQRAASSAGPRCRVCREAISVDAGYCENCGYPTPGQD